MTILAPELTSFAWCSAHLPTDTEDVVHISREQVVPLDEHNELYLSIEKAPGAAAAIRLQGGKDAPMTPAKAMHLARVLQELAFAAVSGGTR